MHAPLAACLLAFCAAMLGAEPQPRLAMVAVIELAAAGSAEGVSVETFFVEASGFVQVSAQSGEAMSHVKEGKIGEAAAQKEMAALLRSLPPPEGAEGVDAAGGSAEILARRSDGKETRWQGSIARLPAAWREWREQLRGVATAEVRATGWVASWPLAEVDARNVRDASIFQTLTPAQLAECAEVRTAAAQPGRAMAVNDLNALRRLLGAAFGPDLRAVQVEVGGSLIQLRYAAAARPR